MLLVPPVSAGIAFIGCGFVADYYRAWLDNHSPTVRLTGVFDVDRSRQDAFCRTHGDSGYASLEKVLDDPAVDVVVNLTPPQEHVAVSRAAIEAGKNVYSEKPLAMTMEEAEELRVASTSADVGLASAPCNHLGEAAQTLWQALREGRIGKPRLAYAEIDDRMIHKLDHGDWRSVSGAPWSARNEFEVGCTFEHAGYALTILCCLFGPVRRVISFSKLVCSDKEMTPAPQCAPDFSVGCLEFDDDVIARITNSVVASYDHRLRVFGDRGTLSLLDIWDYGTPVRFVPTPLDRIRGGMERRSMFVPAARVPLARRFVRRRAQPRMDFMRGIRELADARRERRASRMAADLGVHVTEVTEILQHPDRFGRPAEVRSTFDRMLPMDWAA